ncbi:Ssl1-like-domain-containing protein [Suillus occidentalis]|nr:Ssl1-like-domain-containing protein [Suillus occidentalis]
MTSTVYSYDAARRHDRMMERAPLGLDVTLKEIRPEIAAIFSAFSSLLRLPSWLPGMRLKRISPLAKELALGSLENPFAHTERGLATGSISSCVVADHLLELGFSSGNSAWQKKGTKESAATALRGKAKGKATDKRKKDKGKAKAKEQAYTWEASYRRSWDTMQEDEAGSLQGAVGILWRGGGEGGPFAPRLALLLALAAAIRRTIIRHLALLLDLSAAMMDRDMRPTRFDLMLQYAREFVVEWFDQNPLGQIGVVGMRAGIGEMSGNPQDVHKCLCDRTRLEPTGEPSPQNGIEMA